MNYRNSKKIAALTVAALIMNSSSPMLEVLANEVSPIEASMVEPATSTTSPIVAKVSKLQAYHMGTAVDEAYSELFRLPSTSIINISTNGGTYYDSNVNYMIDGKPETHWETNKSNGPDFTNEVVFTFNEVETLDRVAFLARENRKGFPEVFEIYASETAEGETFQKVAYGTATQTNDFVEFKFNPTRFKRLKFKFVRCAVQDRAFAAEFRFYKPDALNEKYDRLFTDSNMNKLSEDFDTLEELIAFENELLTHPLYPLYEEGLANAKAILTDKELSPTKATVSPVDYYLNTTYNDGYRVPYTNIKSITNNGRHYASQNINKAIDEDITTYWETGKLNDATFSNEVEVEFNDLVTLDRILYGARQSDLKGFAQEFEIYASRTSVGDTYKLVATGAQKAVKGLVEVRFEPTEFKRIKFKFKSSTQNSASLNELMFYKPDEIYTSAQNLFTDGTMSALNEAFDTKEELDAFEAKAKDHPLYDLIKQNIQEARDLLSGQTQTIKTVIAEQQGDRVAHANKNLKIGLGNNNQPTGILAKAGDTITVYVDVEPGKPVPQLFFSQQEGSWANWGKTVQLKPGKNEIVVPEVTQHDGWYHHSVTPGGPIYIVNPYTAEQQGKAPTLRFTSGVEKFPFFDKYTDEATFIEFLKEYKQRVDEDATKHPNVMEREMIDTFEIVADHVVITATATSAYKAYVEGNFTPSKTISMYNDHLDMLFKYQGLDGSDEKNDIKYTRENIRLAQPYGYMYAAGSHTGVQKDVLVDLLTTVGGWGIDHEIGHRMDIGVRTLGEITNNMLPQKSADYYNKTAENRIPYESHVYKNVIAIGNNVYANGGYFEKLAAFWQLEMIYPGYWANLNRIYRENDIKVTDENDKLDKLAYYSSMAVERDLTEYFERHGFPVSNTTKEFAKTYNKPEKKIWYANNSYSKYTGAGFTSNPNLQVSTAKQGENIKVSFTVDDAFKNDVMGYEVYRNDELVAFTSTNSFVDTGVNYKDAVTYKVVPFDKKLNPGEAVQVSSYTPTIKVQQDEITLKLGETFDPSSIVNAYNYKGEDISNAIQVDHNINTNETGVYTLTYSVTDEKITTQKTVKVKVVSNYDYLSDTPWTSVKNGYGTPRRNTNISGHVNGVVKTFQKGFGIHANGSVVYDLADENYETFEALLGVDAGIQAQNKSSINFKIIGDGEVLATTKTLNYYDDMVYVNVPVKGVKQLTIEISDAGNGNAYDHGIISNPILTTNDAKPKLVVGETEAIQVGDDYDLTAFVQATDAEDGDLTESVVVNDNGFNPNKAGAYTINYSVTDKDGNTTTAEKQIFVYSESAYLSDLNWESATAGGGAAVSKDKSVSGRPLRLLDENQSVETFKKGIGTHAYSEIVYNVEGYDVFDTWVGMDQRVAGENSSVIFKVFVDGELKAQTDIMRPTTPKQHLVVDIRDASQVKLVVDTAENWDYWDHADWADAKLHSLKATTDVETLNTLIEKANALEIHLYTAKSTKVLQDALKVANDVIAQENPSQEEIDLACETLDTAINDLVLSKGKALFKPLLEVANQMQQSDYDASADWANFAELRDYYNKLYLDVTTHDEVALEAAADYFSWLIEDMESHRVAADASLKALVDDAKALDIHLYTAASTKTLQAALQAANDVLAQENPSQDKIDVAYEVLDTAMDNLVISKGKALFKPLLEVANQMQQSDYDASADWANFAELRDYYNKLYLDVTTHDEVALEAAADYFAWLIQDVESHRVQ